MLALWLAVAAAAAQTYAIDPSTDYLRAVLYEVPVTLSSARGGRWAEGYVRLRQTDFAIRPFKVAGGAVRVRDDLVVKFRLLLRQN